MRILDMPVQVFLPLCALYGDLASATDIFPRTEVPQRIGIMYLFKVSV
jgi:hypothetical protein